ncbi:hypothetical protein LSH36_669g02048, partial [Paralvinella palmiformis]
MYHDKERQTSQAENTNQYFEKSAVNDKIHTECISKPKDSENDKIGIIEEGITYSNGENNDTSIVQADEDNGRAFAESNRPNVNISGIEYDNEVTYPSYGGDKQICETNDRSNEEKLDLRSRQKESTNPENEVDNKVHRYNGIDKEELQVEAKRNEDKVSWTQERSGSNNETITDEESHNETEIKLEENGSGREEVEELSRIRSAHIETSSELSSTENIESDTAVEDKNQIRRIGKVSSDTERNETGNDKDGNIKISTRGVIDGGEGGMSVDPVNENRKESDATDKGSVCSVAGEQTPQPLQGTTIIQTSGQKKLYMNEDSISDEDKEDQCNEESKYDEKASIGAKTVDESETKNANLKDDDVKTVRCVNSAFVEVGILTNGESNALNLLDDEVYTDRDLRNEIYITEEPKADGSRSSDGTHQTRKQSGHGYGDAAIIPNVVAMVTIIVIILSYIDVTYRNAAHLVILAICYCSVLTVLCLISHHTRTENKDDWETRTKTDAEKRNDAKIQEDVNPDEKQTDSTDEGYEVNNSLLSSSEKLNYVIHVGDKFYSSDEMNIDECGSKDGVEKNNIGVTQTGQSNKPDNESNGDAKSVRASNMPAVHLTEDHGDANTEILEDSRREDNMDVGEHQPQETFEAAPDDEDDRRNELKSDKPDQRLNNQTRNESFAENNDLVTNEESTTSDEQFLNKPVRNENKATNDLCFLGGGDSSDDRRHTVAGAEAATTTTTTTSATTTTTSTTTTAYGDELDIDGSYEVENDKPDTTEDKTSHNPENKQTNVNQIKKNTECDLKTDDQVIVDRKGNGRENEYKGEITGSSHEETDMVKLSNVYGEHQVNDDRLNKVEGNDDTEKREESKDDKYNEESNDRDESNGETSSSVEMTSKDDATTDNVDEATMGAGVLSEEREQTATRCSEDESIDNSDNNDYDTRSTSVDNRMHVIEPEPAQSDENGHAPGTIEEKYHKTSEMKHLQIAGDKQTNDERIRQTDEVDKIPILTDVKNNTIINTELDNKDFLENPTSEEMKVSNESEVTDNLDIARNDPSDLDIPKIKVAPEGRRKMEEKDQGKGSICTEDNSTEESRNDNKRVISTNMENVNRIGYPKKVNRTKYKRITVNSCPISIVDGDIHMDINVVINKDAEYPVAIKDGLQNPDRHQPEAEIAKTEMVLGENVSSETSLAAEETLKEETRNYPSTTNRGVSYSNRKCFDHELITIKVTASIISDNEAHSDVGTQTENDNQIQDHSKARTSSSIKHEQRVIDGAVNAIRCGHDDTESVNSTGEDNWISRDLTVTESAISRFNESETNTKPSSPSQKFVLENCFQFQCQQRDQTDPTDSASGVKSDADISTNIVTDVSKNIGPDLGRKQQELQVDASDDKPYGTHVFETCQDVKNAEHRNIGKGTLRRDRKSNIRRKARKRWLTIEGAYIAMSK